MICCQGGCFEGYAKLHCEKSISLHNLNVLCVEDVGTVVPYLPWWGGAIATGATFIDN